PRRRASGATLRTSVSSAPQPEASMTPASRMRRGAIAPWAGPRLAPPAPSVNSSSVETAAPTQAEPVTRVAPAPAHIARTAPSAPPPETPSTQGSASGLRSSTCRSAPASASRPPPAKPAAARGRRRPSTSSRASGSAPSAHHHHHIDGLHPPLPQAPASAMPSTTTSAISGQAMRGARRIERAGSGGLPAQHHEEAAPRGQVAMGDGRIVVRNVVQPHDEARVRKDPALQPQPEPRATLEHDGREGIDPEVVPRAAPGDVRAGIPGAEPARDVERAEAFRPAQQRLAGLAVRRRLEGRARREAPA